MKRLAIIVWSVLVAACVPAPTIVPAANMPNYPAALQQLRQASDGLKSAFDAVVIATGTSPLDMNAQAHFRSTATALIQAIHQLDPSPLTDGSPNTLYAPPTARAAVVAAQDEFLILEDATAAYGATLRATLDASLAAVKLALTYLT